MANVLKDRKSRQDNSGSTKRHIWVRKLGPDKCGQRFESPQLLRRIGEHHCARYHWKTDPQRENQRNDWNLFYTTHQTMELRW
eukprot:scaffold657_cov108-Cylindrotheca_fusiformis.AAC.8